jgi:hypothetical protein
MAHCAYSVFAAEENPIQIRAVHRTPILKARVLRILHNDATFKAGYPCFVHDNVKPAM